MRTIAKTLVLLALTVSMHSAPLHAKTSSLDKYMEKGSGAIKSGNFKKAIYSLKRAVKELEKPEDRSTSKIHVKALCLLSRAQTKEGDFGEALANLTKSIELYKSFGLADRELATSINDEYAKLASKCTTVDLDKLGKGASEALLKNRSVITLLKNGGVYEVSIDSPEKFDSPTGSNTIDTIRLDKKVTFKLIEESDGKVKAQDIKGFQIRSVEKNMWVNLYDCSIQARNGEGEYPSEISAGKMGVIKHVNRALPERIYAPVGGIIASIHAMNGKAALSPLTVPEETEVPQPPENREKVEEPKIEDEKQEIATPTESAIESVDSAVEAAEADEFKEKEQVEQIKQLEPQAQPEPMVQTEAPIKSEPVKTDADIETIDIELRHTDQSNIQESLDEEKPEENREAEQSDRLQNQKKADDDNDEKKAVQNSVKSKKKKRADDDDDKDKDKDKGDDDDDDDDDDDNDDKDKDDDDDDD